MNDVTLKRLLLVKRLLLHGVAHSQRDSEINRFLAIHHVDNAVELFLKIIATEEGVATSSRQDYKFKDLWELINQKTMEKTPQYALPMKDQIFALHDTRNLAQHQGDAPSYETTIKYSEYAKDFLTKTIGDIFSINFEDIHGAILVNDANIKMALIEAERNLEEGKNKECIMSTAKAFSHLKVRETRRFSSGRLSSFTTFGLIDRHGDVNLEPVHSFDRMESGIYDKINDAIVKYNRALNSKLKERAEKINEFAEAVGEEIAILEMGLDYAKFRKFRAIVPPAHFISDSNIIVLEPAENNCIRENAIFCYDFMLDAALSLQ